MPMVVRLVSRNVSRYYEDLTIGNSQTIGTVTADRDEMLSFAKQYDPQPFHTDPEAAAESHFGELVASGWYTAALCMRCLVDAELNSSGAQGALGIDSLRWPAPVRPGDELTVSTRIDDKRLSESHPDSGVVTTSLEAIRDDGATVLEWTATLLWARRSPS